MTPDQERALLAAAAAGVDDAVREAYDELVQLIRDGMPPRDAVQQVMDGFRGDLAGIMSEGLSAVLQASVGAAAAMDIEAGTVQLSRRLYGEAMAVSETVNTVVRRHLAGFADARKLALDLFEGYGFREPGAEPLKIAPNNPKLPEYLRRYLLDDPYLRAGFDKAFARVQVSGLSTPALRAAYTGLLDAIDTLRLGRGEKVLEKRLEIAFYERVRYFASRIAQTEIHRAYQRREAAIMMADTDIEFVQVRRAPGRGDPCICVLYAGRDLYGLGPGVYPKARAPLSPFHPFCRCVVVPRLDLTGRKARPMKEDEDAYFLRHIGERTAARVMGSQAKLDRVLKGQSADAVHALGVSPEYQVKRVGEVV